MRRRKISTQEHILSSTQGNEERVSLNSTEKEPKLAPSPGASSANDAAAGKGKGNDTLTFAIAKWAILRLMGVIYFVAFLGAFFQNEGLMGKNGLVPAEKHMAWLAEQHPSSAWEGFTHYPALFWWIDLNDSNMQGIVWLGMLLSSLVVAGVNSWVIQLALWLLDFSIVTISGGTSFYNYGWESQILETGFLSIFLCALPYATKEKGRWKVHFSWWESSVVDTHALKPSSTILWLFRWLSFRISLGAGLIKTRGSSCWADKTCLHYHFQTQPLPSPLSFVYHFLPQSIQTRMVDVDLWVQLYTSWLVLLPMSLPGKGSAVTNTSSILRAIVRIGGFIQAGFMVGIALSGNFSFLNHLTIIPALACLDDACWPNVLHRLVLHSSAATTPARPLLTRKVLDLVLLLVIGYLSWPVVSNLLQRNGHQMMNASFDSFRLVNTYGAFGSVGKARYEPIVSVSDDGVQWREIEFPCKPGDVTRRPCFCAPYHYRADWNIWFIGFKPHKSSIQGRERWVYALLGKMLQPSTPANQRPWLRLLDSTAITLLQRYYNKQNAPKYAKVDMFHYRMAAPLQTIIWRWINGQGQIWWTRIFEESLVAPVMLDDASGMLAWANLNLNSR